MTHNITILKGLTPREQKKCLLAEIEKAIKHAPARRYKLLGTITIEVSEGVQYEIINTKEALKVFQKRLGKFPTGTPKTSEKRSPTNPTTLSKIPKTRPTATKDIDKIVSTAVSTDESREILMHSHLNGDAEELVATDGRRLYVALEIKGKTTKRMISERIYNSKTKEIELTGKMIVGVYPNYALVVPGYKKGFVPGCLKNKAKINTTEFLSKVLQAIGVYKGESKTGQSIKLIQMPNGEIEVKIVVADIGEYQSAEIEKGNGIVLLDPEHLKDSLNFLRRMGNETVKLSWTDDLSPIIITGIKEYVIMMPMRVV